MAYKTSNRTLLKQLLFVLMILTNCYLSYAQITILNSLSFNYRITLNCLDQRQSFSLYIHDTSFGTWLEPKTILISDTTTNICACKDFLVRITSDKDDHLLSFLYSHYNTYLKEGNDLDNYNVNSNNFILCSIPNSEERFPCNFPNSCGVVEINKAECKITIRKPNANYCPN